MHLSLLSVPRPQLSRLLLGPGASWSSSSCITANGSSKQAIHILGAGSIGCLLGAQLAHGGFPVTFLQRAPAPAGRDPPLLQWVRNHSLPPLELPVTVESTQVTHSAPVIDRLIVTTKAHQLASALASLGPRFDPEHTALVLVQNGYGQHLTHGSPLQAARSAHPQFSTIGWGSTNNGAYLETPGGGEYWRSVVHAGRGHWHFGPVSLDDPLDPAHPRDAEPCLPGTAALLHDLVQALAPDATMHTTPGAMTQVLLHKLAINACINALTGIARVPNGDLLQAPFPDQMARLADEAAAVLHATYGPGGFPYSGAQVLADALRVCELTRHNKSSTYVDVWERHEVPRELDYVHGTLVAWGKRAGVPTPMHEDVWARVVQGTRERERHRRAELAEAKKGWWHHVRRMLFSKGGTPDWWWIS